MRNPVVQKSSHGPQVFCDLVHYSFTQINNRVTFGHFFTEKERWSEQRREVVWRGREGWTINKASVSLCLNCRMILWQIGKGFSLFTLVTSHIWSISHWKMAAYYSAALGKCTQLPKPLSVMKYGWSPAGMAHTHTHKCMLTHLCTGVHCNLGLSALFGCKFSLMNHLLFTGNVS